SPSDCLRGCKALVCTRSLPACLTADRRATRCTVGLCFSYSPTPIPSGHPHQCPSLPIDLMGSPPDLGRLAYGSPTRIEALSHSLLSCQSSMPIGVRFPRPPLGLSVRSSLTP